MPGDPDPITGLTSDAAQRWVARFLLLMHDFPETAEAKLTRVQEMIPAALERARALQDRVEPVPMDSKGNTYTDCFTRDPLEGIDPIEYALELGISGLLWPEDGAAPGGWDAHAAVAALRTALDLRHEELRARLEGPDGDAAEHFRRGYQTRDAEVADLTRERDEDRAEVERLKAIIQAPHAWEPGERQRARLAMDVAASALESEHAYDGEAIVRALREALDEDTPDEFLPPWVTLGSPLKLFIDVPGDDAQIVQRVVVKSIVEAAGTPYAFVVRCEPFDEPLPSLDKLVGDVRFHVTSVSGMTALRALVERLMGVVAGADEEGAPIPREGMDVVFDELERAERTLRPRERGGVKVSPNEAEMFLDVARRFGAEMKSRPWQVGDLVAYQLSGKAGFGRVIRVRDDGSVEVREREPTTEFGRKWLFSGRNLDLLMLVTRPWAIGDVGQCPAPERPERTLTVCVTGLVGDGHVKLRERSGGPDFLLPVEKLTRLEGS